MLELPVDEERCLAVLLIIAVNTITRDTRTSWLGEGRFIRDVIYSLVYIIFVYLNTSSFLPSHFDLCFRP